MFHIGYVACHDSAVVDGSRVEDVEVGVCVEEIWIVVLEANSEAGEGSIASEEGAVIGIEIDEVVEIDEDIEIVEVVEVDEDVEIDEIVEVNEDVEIDEVVEVDEDVEHSTVELELVIEADSEVVDGAGLATLTTVILNSFVTVLGCSSLIMVTDMIEVGAGSLTDAVVIDVFTGIAVAMAEGIGCSVAITDEVFTGSGFSLATVGVASELPSTATTE